LGVWYADWEHSAKNPDADGIRDSTLRIENRSLLGALGVHEDARVGRTSKRRVPVGIY